MTKLENNIKNLCVENMGIYGCKHAVKEHVWTGKVHINFKPGNHTPLGMWRKGSFFYKKIKNSLIFLLSSEKFSILNTVKQRLIRSAERRRTDASKRTGCKDSYKGKTVP